VLSVPQNLLSYLPNDNNLGLDLKLTCRLESAIEYSPVLVSSIVLTLMIVHPLAGTATVPSAPDWTPYVIHSLSKFSM
jgi:hypothetical protein